MANIEQVEHSMKCRAYEQAYTETIWFVLDTVDCFTCALEEMELDFAQKHTGVEVNDVTRDAVRNAVSDAFGDLYAMTKVENVTSVRV